MNRSEPNHLGLWTFLLVTLAAVGVTLIVAGCWSTDAEGNGTLSRWALLGDAVGGVLTCSLVYFAARELMDARETLELQTDAFNSLGEQIRRSTAIQLLNDTPIFACTTVAVPGDHHLLRGHVTEGNQEPLLFRLTSMHSEPLHDVSVLFHRCNGYRTTPMKLAHPGPANMPSSFAALFPNLDHALHLFCEPPGDQDASIEVLCSTRLRQYKAVIPVTGKFTEMGNQESIRGVPIQPGPSARP